MIALVVILLILLLICLTPVGAQVIYHAEGVFLNVKAGPVSIPILPKKEKEKTEKQLKKEQEKQRKKEEKKAAKKAAKEAEKQRKKEEKQQEKARKKAGKSRQPADAPSPDGGAAPEPPPEKKQKQPLGGKIAFFKELLGIGLSALNCIRRKLIMKDLVLYLTVGGQGEDAAKAAILYGRAWAAVGALTPVLEKTFHIKNRDIQVNIDFLQPENVIYAKATILFRIGDILWIALNHGFRAGIAFLKQKRKGRKHNGTSHQ